MAQEIVRLCDPCLADDVRVNAAAYTLTVDGMARVLDLCPDHFDSIVKPLEALLGRYGQPVPGVPTVKRKYARKAAEAAPVAPVADPVAAEGDSPCPFCPAVYTSKSGLAGHLSSRGIPAPYALVAGRCPFDGAVFPGSGPGNLAAHVASEHGAPTVAAAVVAARAAGVLDDKIGRKLTKLQGAHDGA